MGAEFFTKECIHLLMKIHFLYLSMAEQNQGVNSLVDIY